MKDVDAIMHVMVEEKEIPPAALFARARQLLKSILLPFNFIPTSIFHVSGIPFDPGDEYKMIPLLKKRLLSKQIIKIY